MRKLAMLLAGGGVLVLLTSTVSLASGTRAASIKSHGTLEYKSETQDVLLTTEDLKSLANDIDYLEGILDALNNKNDPHIVYEYHYHTGDSKHNGGCYTTGYHVHTTRCSDKCECKYDEFGNCIKHKHTWTCGYPHNNWKLSCGKQNGQIVKATISFD